MLKGMLGKNMGLFSKAIVALIMGASLSTASVANDKPLPLANETLNVAFSIAPPFVLVRGQFSELAGIDVDLVRELQRRTGFKASNNRYDIMNFSDMMELGAKGEIDIIGGGIYASEERDKIFDFAVPSYRTAVALVTHKNSPVQNIKDLAGKVVAAENGTVASDLIPPESGVKVNMMNTPTSFMALYSVSRGLADAVITDVPLAQEYIDNWPNSDLAIRMIMPDSEADMAIILKSGTKATKILQATYKEMLLDGTVAKIVQSYSKNVDTSVFSAAVSQDDFVATSKVETIIDDSETKGFDSTQKQQVSEILPKDSRLVLLNNNKEQQQQNVEAVEDVNAGEDEIVE